MVRLVQSISSKMLNASGASVIASVSSGTSLVVVSDDDGGDTVLSLVVEASKGALGFELLLCIGETSQAPSNSVEPSSSDNNIFFS